MICGLLITGSKNLFIGSSFENESKTIAVHCRANGNKSGLIDGMNITGIVSLNNVTTPAVPNDAIVNAEGKFYVFVQTGKKAEEHHEEGGHKEKEEKDTTRKIKPVRILKKQKC